MGEVIEILINAVVKNWEDGTIPLLIGIAVVGFALYFVFGLVYHFIKDRNKIFPKESLTKKSDENAGFQARNKSNSSKLNDPKVQTLIKKVNNYGSYDGSSKSKAKAQTMFNNMADLIGCVNPSTNILYRETLIQTELSIPLVVCYAFAVGEYLENPSYKPYGMNSRNASDNASGMDIFFPEYGSFVLSKHKKADALMIMAISSYLIEDLRW